MKNLTHTCNYQLCTYDELSMQDRQLIEAAKVAAESSYAPYSHFHVGVAVSLDDGTIVTGSNQENAAYPSGLCAERTALFYAGAAYPDKGVAAIAIAAKNGKGFIHAPITPCGACRQVMLETELRHGHPMRILLFGIEEVCVVEGGACELLPLNFAGEYLTLPEQ